MTFMEKWAVWWLKSLVRLRNWKRLRQETSRKHQSEVLASKRPLSTRFSRATTDPFLPLAQVGRILVSGDNDLLGQAINIQELMTSTVKQRLD